MTKNDTNPEQRRIITEFAQSLIASGSTNPAAPKLLRAIRMNSPVIMAHLQCVKANGMYDGVREEDVPQLKDLLKSVYATFREPASEAKTDTILTRVTAEHKRMLCEIAQATGENQSEIIRRLIESAHETEAR